MIPKIIHYCWLSNDPMPGELQKCINSWKKHMPEYIIKKWDKKNSPLFIPYVQEAIKAKKWAFACDYIRVYALYNEGGIYLDSDVFVKGSFNNFLINKAFTAVECYPDLRERLLTDGVIDSDGNRIKNQEFIHGIQIQAAILGSEKGHPFFKECMEYYDNKHFINQDGSYNSSIISPFIFANIAERYGFKFVDKLQNLKNGLVIYPSSMFAPNMDLISKDCIAIHCCAGSWRWMPSSRIGYLIQLIKEYIKNILFNIGLIKRKYNKL